MKKFITEFKEFIAQGNAMDMAIGIIIGAAFTAIVTSLVEDIINPVISIITGGNGTDVSWLNVDGIMFGNFIGAIINFIIIALVVFCLIKAINKMQTIGKAGKKFVKKGGEEMIEEAPTCPFCMEEVAVGSTRCPHCTSDFESPAEVKLVPAE